MGTSEPIKSRQLAEMYQAHHQRGARDGYVYGGEHRLRLFRHWIGTGGRVLDLGCRDGMVAATLVEGNRVVGADIDSRALSAAAKIPNVGLVQADLNHLFPFAPESFDVVLAGELIEHVFFPVTFLAQVAEVLRPGGKFIGSTPNTFRLRNRLRFLWGVEFDTDPTHLHRFSPAALRQVLGRYFRRVRIEPVAGHFLGGGRTGIPVWSAAPYALRRLFALDLCWIAEDPIRRGDG